MKPSLAFRLEARPPALRGCWQHDCLVRDKAALSGLSHEGEVALTGETGAPRVCHLEVS